MNFKKNPPREFPGIDSLSPEEAREEAEALREAIDHHDFLYYVKNQPEISDAAYDRLFHRLKELEEAFPELESPTSPTRRVGAEPVSRLKKVEHSRPMLSLNSALEESKVREFVDFVRRNVRGEIRWVLEPKFDGFSVEVVYREGVFQYGSTRGNGDIGEDISENLKTVRTLPLRLRREPDLPSFLSVRGEVFMSRQGFLKLNQERIEQGEDPFANPRNAAAGTMRQLDPKIVAERPLEIIFYDILAVEDSEIPSTHWETLQRFSEWGLRTYWENRRCQSFGEIVDYRQGLLSQREEFDYELDGIVIKLDDFSMRESLGTRQRSPRWAFAWKFPPKEEVTILEKILVQVGRTGILTPVALLQPVDVGGVTVSRATLHNEDEVRRKDVRPKDRVRVARAGDVIPEVVERIDTPGSQRREPFSMPERCPVCDSEVYRDGAYTVCPAGLSCPAQVIGGIIHYGSRRALDIAGLGEKTAQDLFRKGLVRNIADLYRLSVDDLKKLDGFAEKSATQLHEAIQATKQPPLDRFLYALGIRHVGERVAKVLASRFKELEALRSADETALTEVHEIGPEIAGSVTQFFSQEVNQKVLQGLAEADVRPVRAADTSGEQPLSGKTFVFTGSLSNFTRKEAQRRVEALGGRATSSVSGETDFLVVGENPGSKLDQAREQDVAVLEEKDFLKLIES